MAGELIVKHGLRVSGSTIMSGSLTATSFTGSFSGSITSASYAATASIASTASFFSGSISNATSASFASTASLAPLYTLVSATSSMLAPYLLVTNTSSFVTNSQTGSFVVNSQTGSFVLNSFTSSMLVPYLLVTNTGSMIAPYLLISNTSSMLSPYLPTTRTGSLATTGSGTFSGSITISSSLGVGTAAPATVGLIRATNDVVAFYSSDERLKTNKQIISNPLEKLNQINGYEFDWIPTPGIHENEGHDIGVIAQEIEKVLPEIVTTRDNGYKAVKYEKIVALLIEAVKDLQNQVNELKNGSSNF